MLWKPYFLDAISDQVVSIYCLFMMQGISNHECSALNVVVEGLTARDQVSFGPSERKFLVTMMILQSKAQFGHHLLEALIMARGPLWKEGEEYLHDM